MNDVDRVLDANVNRAAEGMRVLEDIARFVLVRQELCKAIKQCRHDLRHGTKAIPLSRDTSGDVGTSITTQSEVSRNTVMDVAIASGNRCGEALRVIEEFLKLNNKENLIEQIRYSMYDLSAAVVMALRSTVSQWNMCFVMTADECVLTWQETLLQAVEAGCDCVQIREKTLTTKQLLLHTISVIELVKEHNTAVIVNDRVDVAMATGASGVHVGIDDMPIQEVKQLVPKGMFIGATVHSFEEAQTSIELGADYIGIGAMFPSSTKPSASVNGISMLRTILEAFPNTHHLAIGGVTPSNVAQLRDVGCQGVAICAAIAHSQTPGQVVEDVLSGAMQLS